jgi:hypothetical protein
LEEDDDGDYVEDAPDGARSNDELENEEPVPKVH